MQDGLAREETRVGLAANALPSRSFAEAHPKLLNIVESKDAGNIKGAPFAESNLEINCRQRETRDSDRRMFHSICIES